VNTPGAQAVAVPLAWAIADSQSSAELTATAGPNSSSWLNGGVGVDVGHDGRADDGAVALAAGEQLPRAVDGGLRWRRSTRSASAVVISVPIVVSADDGSPVRIASTLGTSASRKSPVIEGWVMTRWTEMHTCPALT
jgi:hypothetical protein